MRYKEVYTIEKIKIYCYDQIKDSKIKGIDHLIFNEHDNTL